MLPKTAFFLLLVATAACAAQEESYAAEDEDSLVSRELYRRNLLTTMENKVSALGHKIKDKVHGAEAKVYAFATKLGNCAKKEKPALNGAGTMELKAATSCVAGLVDKASGLLATVISAAALSGLEVAALRLASCMAVKNYPLAKTILTGIASCMRK